MNRLIRKALVPFAAAACLMAIAVPSQAATIPGLFNTGVLDDGTVAATGAVDLHYLLIASADPNFPGPNTYVANPIPAGLWLANSSTSRWIGPAVNQGYPTGAAAHTIGDYTYRLTFDLTGLDPATASVTGNWAADNNGLFIRLNGVNTPGNVAPVFTSLRAFTVSSGFVAGLNTLDFVVRNTSGSGSNPTGLRVSDISGSANAAVVPAPAAIWLLGTGMLSLAGARVRRRR
jgi:hypothetical protein